MKTHRRAGQIPWLIVPVLAAIVVAGCKGPGARTDEWIAQEVYKSVSAAAAPAVTPVEEGKAPPPAPAAGAAEVRLSLLDALHRALTNNHDIQIAGLAPHQAEQDIIAAEAVFDPSVFLSNTFGRVNRPTQSQLDTGALQPGSLIQDTWSYQAGLKSRVPTGGTLAVYEASDYMNSNSQFVLPNPQYATRLAVELAHPLLRGAGIDYNQAAIRVANLNGKVSFQDFRKNVTDVVASVSNAYWQLAFDLESVRVSRASMDLAAEVLRRETARQQKGVSAEVDVNRAQAAVSIRQAELIRTESQARDSMDRLKFLMNAPDLPLAAEGRLIPVESPQFYLVSVNRTEAIATALARRPDLEKARAALAVNRIRLDAADNERLPKLDATLRYMMNGLGGNMGDAIDMQSIRERDSWIAGFEFELPLGNRAADSSRRKRILEYDQSLVELDKTAATATQEVNTAVRAVLQAREEVEATLQGKIAAAGTVRGEQRRFELGQSTNDELLRAQETLANAERDHLRALLNFNLGLVALGRAQGTLLENQGVEIFQPEGTREHPRPVGLRPLPQKGPAPAAKPPGAQPAPAGPKTPAAHTGRMAEPEKKPAKATEVPPKVQTMPILYGAPDGPPNAPQKAPTTAPKERPTAAAAGMPYPVAEQGKEKPITE